MCQNIWIENSLASRLLACLATQNYTRLLTCWLDFKLVGYCIAGNNWGRKLSQILKFCGYSWNVSLWSLGVWHLLAAPVSIPWKFSLWNFNQLVKVFSRESFPLYSIHKVKKWLTKPAWAVKKWPAHPLDDFTSCVHGQLSSHSYWKEAAKHDLGAKLVS